ncbi:MAG: hypothetical protein P4L40_11455 [Terracidiphilus sp.]|nr:hypothetical protein [Terracidiphilus sp.]
MRAFPSSAPQVSPYLRRLGVSGGVGIDDAVCESLHVRKTFWGNSVAAGTGSLEWVNLGQATKLTSLGIGW